MFRRSNDNEWNFTVINDYFLKAGNFRLGTLFKNVRKDKQSILTIFANYAKIFRVFLNFV